MYPLISMPGGWEWLIILAIVLVVFGASKLPNIARNSGQALRIFKAETKALKDEDAKASDLPQAASEAADPEAEKPASDN